MAMSISPPSFDEGRFALLHFVQDCHSFVLTYASFPFFIGSLCRDPVCGGTVWIAGVPGALRNALSGISELGREATTDAIRKKSLSLTSLDRVVFCVMSNSESIHIWCNVKPVFGSIYHLFQTALWAHWGALRLISTRSLFMSYSLAK